jgi:hypothetical protein
MGEKKHEGLGTANDAKSASVSSTLPTHTQSTLSVSSESDSMEPDSIERFPIWDSSFFARLCDAGIKGRASGATGV